MNIFDTLQTFEDVSLGFREHFLEQTIYYQISKTPIGLIYNGYNSYLQPYLSLTKTKQSVPASQVTADMHRRTIWSDRWSLLIVFKLGVASTAFILLLASRTVHQCAERGLTGDAHVKKWHM